MKKTIGLLFCLWMTGAIIPAYALESPWSSTAEMQARILLGSNTIAPDQDHLSAALQVRLAPGWHSYWRNPGESGLAPGVHWDASENIAELAMAFPAPKRFKEMDLTTFGYEGDVTYPMDIKLENPGQPAKIDLKLDMMVCNEICIPATLPLTLEVKTGQGLDSQHVAVIDYARRKIPSAADNPQLKIENITVSKDKIVASLYSKRGFARVDVIAEMGDIALGSDPELQKDAADKNRALAVIAIPEDIQDELQDIAAANEAGGAPYAGQTIRVTLIEGRDAVEQMMVPGGI